MTEMSPEAYDDIADAIKLLAAGSYLPAQEPLREALSWLKIADEADAWIKMTEAELERRRSESPENRKPLADPRPGSAT